MRARRAEAAFGTLIPRVRAAAHAFPPFHPDLTGALRIAYSSPRTGRRCAGGDLRPRCCADLLQFARRALQVDVPQDGPERAGQPPVGAGDEAHRVPDEDPCERGCVKGHGGGPADAEQLLVGRSFETRCPSSQPDTSRLSAATAIFEAPSRPGSLGVAARRPIRAIRKRADPGLRWVSSKHCPGAP
jgi:hypothetical protein